MKPVFKVTLLLLTVVLLLASGNSQAWAQTGVSGFFAETGHNVTGDFWTYYQRVPQARQVFGYPITEAFTDSRTGRLVQYFTRARFEFYPEFPEGQRVRLGDLGQALYQPGASLDMFTPLGCQAFSTGFSVCYAFLDYFVANGGEAIFGAPVSSFEFYNGRIVQHFQRARFEWYPELADGQKVVLADLGRIYFDQVPEDPNLLTPVRPSNIIESVLEIRVHAFMQKAVTGPVDEQTLYVVVQDQTLGPVRDAIVAVVVTWSDGSQQSISMPSDENGTVILPFAVTGQAHGSLVLVDVQVFYEGLQTDALTSFRIWQ